MVFLTGAESNDFTIEKNAILGQRFRPYLWDTSSGQISNLSEDLNVSGNHRLIGYIRDNQWKSTQTSYGARVKKGFSTTNDSENRFQSAAGDILLDGAFNINSTSVDAWIAQLSSLRGLVVENETVSSSETPVVRFLSEPEQDENEWNDLRTLTDEEIKSLATALVKQVKLRGPFLSFADFVNRRLALGPMDSDPSKAKGTRVNFVQYNLSDWSKYREDRFTAQGLRGAVQSAIAEAGLNDEREWTSESWIPSVPQFRYNLENGILFDTSFGLRASALSLHNQTNSDTGVREYYLNPNKSSPRTWGIGSSTQIKQINVGDVNGDGRIESVRDDLISYPSTNFGEAPENLLAVEHLATGANKPGWVMQSDILSPLMPVTSARSDTFIIRVMGETNNDSPAKAWAELVVQKHLIM